MTELLLENNQSVTIDMKLRSIYVPDRLKSLFLTIKITKKRYVSDFLVTLHVCFLLAMYHKYNHISGLIPCHGNDIIFFGQNLAYFLFEKSE